MQHGKRTLSLALAIALCISALLPVTATAAEVDDNTASWFNVLDYDTGSDETGNFVSFTSSGSLAYSLGFATTIRHLDITVSINGPALTAVRVTSGSKSYDLTVEEISGYLYRVYGSASFTTDNLVLEFENDGSGTTEVNIQRFYISALSGSHFAAQAELVVESMDVSYAGTTGNGEVAGVTWIASESCGFTVTVELTEWRGYDYIDVYLIGGNLWSIKSIVAQKNGAYLPLSTINFEMNDSGTDLYYVIRVDVSGLDRSSGGNPMLIFSGYVSIDDTCTVYLERALGFVVSDLGDPVLLYFKSLENKLGDWFGSLIGVMSGDTQAAEDFQNTVESQGQELDDAVDQMEQVTKPAVEDIDPGIDDYVSDEDITLVTGVFSPLFETDLFVSMMMITLTMALVGYVLFGKKG